MNYAIPFVENDTSLQPNSAPSNLNKRSASLSFFFVVLFTIAIYARPEDIFPVLAQLHLTFILGLCAGSAFLGSFLLGNVGPVWTRELQIVLLLTGCFVVGVPFAYWRGGSFQVITQVWFKMLIIFFMLTQTLVTVERVRKILWATILSELVVSAYSVVQSSHFVWVGQRVSGVSMGILGWNFLGLAAALTIPYIAAIYICQHGVFRTSLLISSVLFLMWMLVLTASRSGALNVFFSIALTCLLVLRGTSRGKFIGVGIVLIALMAVSLAPGVFWERMATVWSGTENSQNEVTASAVMSQEERMGLLKRAIHYSLENPLFGLGLGNFEIASGMEIGKPEAWLGVHNTFAEISSEAGIPALALFVALLWTAIQHTYKVGKKEIAGPLGFELKLIARATLVSLLSFVFGAFFAHIGYEYFLYYPVAIAVGVQTIARTIEGTSDSVAIALTPEVQTSAMDWGS